MTDTTYQPTSTNFPDNNDGSTEAYVDPTMANENLVIDQDRIQALKQAYGTTVLGGELVEKNPDVFAHLDENITNNEGKEFLTVVDVNTAANEAIARTANTVLALRNQMSKTNGSLEE